MLHITTRKELLRHGLLIAPFAAAIAVALNLGGHGRLDENLVHSFGIAFFSWISIDLGRLWLSRHQAVPWPQGGHGLAGWLLVAGGSTFGYCTGMALGGWYSGRPLQLSSFTAPLALSPSLVIAVVASVVISFFFYSQGKARFLTARMAQAQRDAAEARLALLQAQLEPHMLFNTLANLRVLVATDPARAQAMLDHLIDYLRATLGASRAALRHPLADEFARINDYLALMSIRMGPRLAFTLDLPEPLRALPVPPLLLQPLVENAIRHGLEPAVAGGHIAVRAQRLAAGAGQPERLELVVEDDGAGLPPGGLPPAAPQGASRFGLAQVRERLAVLYGAQATLELIASDRGLTCARAVIPLENLNSPPCPPQPHAP